MNGDLRTTDYTEYTERGKLNISADLHPLLLNLFLINPTEGGLTDFMRTSYIMVVRRIEHSEAVRFTTKGQVVIPQRLRKLFKIEAGTRAILTATDEGILLKPVTAAMVERGFGLLKGKVGGKSLRDEWTEHKRSEREKEEARYARHSAR